MALAERSSELSGRKKIFGKEHLHDTMAAGTGKASL